MRPGRWTVAAPRTPLALAPMLRCFGAGRVVSAPAERCVATVRPFAASIGGVVEIEAAFDVGGSSQDGRNKTTEMAAAMARLAADSRPVVVCAHRENLPALLAAAYSALGAASPPGKPRPASPRPASPRPASPGGKPPAGKPPAGKPLRKGEFAVLHRAAGKLVAFERYHPDGDLIRGHLPPRHPVPELRRPIAALAGSRTAVTAADRRGPVCQPVKNSV